MDVLKREIFSAMKRANLTSAIDLFGKSYALVRKNLNTYALVYVIPAALVIAGVIQLLDNNQDDAWDWSSAFSSSVLGPNLGSDSSFATASTIFAIVLLVASIISYFLATILNLRVVQGQKQGFRSIWNEFQDNWLRARLVGLGILTILILIVGFVLLIIPGIILLWRLFLAPYILIDKKTDVMSSLADSWNMTKGYAWPVYSILLFSLALALTAIVPIVGGLISFVLGVAYAVAPALRYQEIKKAL